MISKFSTSDIAVVGMSCIFPLSGDYDEFWDNLEKGFDGITAIPISRLAELEPYGLPQKEVTDFIRGGYLDSIFQFEPEIFSISPEEANFIDPQQRFLLELVEQAWLDAGYNPSTLPQNVGVFLTENDNAYARYLPENNPLNVFNSISASNASRVAYTYNFTGPVFSIGAACCSSLVSVHTACQHIISGEVDYAVAGGVRLFLLPPTHSQIEGHLLVSPEQKVKAFDKNADGTIGGEGGGILILKSAQKAQADGDFIHAVIKGSAVNNNGRRANGINAPSEDAQAEVILKAIERARIEPLSISYVEAHGAGTQIGDPIELRGMIKALEQSGYPPHSVPIGSVKTNIGHLDVAAGMASLIKTILVLKKRVVPASLHFREPNTAINFSMSPVYVNQKAQVLHSIFPGRAGVTSLSLVGTNAHLIIEESADSTHEFKSLVSNSERFILLSARTADSLTRMVTQLGSYLEKNSMVSLDALSYTLLSGRRLFRENMCIIHAASVKELSIKIKNGEYVIFSAEQMPPVNKTVFIIPDLPQVPQSLLPEGFRSFYLELYDKVGNLVATISRAIEYFIYIQSVLHFLKQCKVNFRAFLGVGAGEIIAKFAAGKLDLEQALEQLGAIEEPMEFDSERYAKAIDKMKIAGIDSYLMLFPDHNLLEITRQKFHNCWEHDCVTGELQNTYNLIIQFLKNGFEIEFSCLTSNLTPNRISVPTYAFNRRSFCHVDQPMTLWNNEGYTSAESDYPLTHRQPDLSQLRDRLIEILNGLYAKELDTNQSFFDLGLSSILITYLIGKIEIEYGLKIPIDLFFEDITVEQIISKIVHNIMGAQITPIISNINVAQESYPVTSGQARLVTLQLLDELSTAYNTSFVIKLSGQLDTRKFETSWLRLVERHESLRTVFSMEEAEIRQLVIENITLPVSFALCSEQEMSVWIDSFVRPFDVNRGPLIRTSVVQVSDRNNEYYWIIDAHHAIIDGISVEILVADMINFYEGLQASYSPVSPKEYAVEIENFRHTSSYKIMEEWWVDQFRQPLKRFCIPTDFIRTPDVFKKTASVEHVITTQLTKQLCNLSVRSRVTLYIALLSVYKVLLFKYSGEEDIIVGTFASGRTGKTERSVGMFVNTLPLRMTISRDQRFADLVTGVKQTFLNALENQAFTIEQLIDALELEYEPGWHPLFTNTFVLQNSYNDHNQMKRMGDLTCISCPSPRNDSPFDIQFEVFEEQEGLRLSVHYAKQLFKETSIRRLLADYNLLLETIVNNENIRVGDLVDFLQETNRESASSHEFNFNFE